jgi:hypothetical protein
MTFNAVSASFRHLDYFDGIPEFFVVVGGGMRVRQSCEESPYGQNTGTE